MAPNIWIKSHIQLVLSYLSLHYYHKVTWWCQMILLSFGFFKDDIWNSTFLWVYLKIIGAICSHEQFKLFYSFHDKLYKLLSHMSCLLGIEEKKNKNNETLGAMSGTKLGNFSHSGLIFITLSFKSYESWWEILTLGQGD